MPSEFVKQTSFANIYRDIYTERQLIAIFFFKNLLYLKKKRTKSLHLTLSKRDKIFQWGSSCMKEIISSVKRIEFRFQDFLLHVNGALWFYLCKAINTSCLIEESTFLFVNWFSSDWFFLTFYIFFFLSKYMIKSHLACIILLNVGLRSSKLQKWRQSHTFYLI